MKANLIFELSMKFQLTNYHPLKEFAIGEMYDYPTKSYKWFFRVSDLEKILAVLATELEFDKKQIDLLVSRCPYLQKKVIIPAYKGIGFVRVTEQPNLYKVTTVINKKETSFKIPKETVKTLWEVIKKQPINKRVKTKTVAENYCKALNIIRFTRKSGTFRWAHFFGSRKDYFSFYYSLKVLCHYNLIVHHKSGLIERKKEDWTIQEELK